MIGEKECQTGREDGENRAKNKGKEKIGRVIGGGRTEEIEVDQEDHRKGWGLNRSGVQTDQVGWAEQGKRRGKGWGDCHA